MVFEGDKKIKTENYADKHWNNEERNVVIAKHSGFITGDLERIAEFVKEAIKSMLARIRELFHR